MYRPHALLKSSCSWRATSTLTPLLHDYKKVVHTRLQSVGFRSWSRFLAVSLQVTWVINPAVGCHYFPPGLQLPSQPLRGLLACYQFRCLVNRGTMGVNSLPKTVTRQRRGCDLNPVPSAPESSTLTTRLPCRLTTRNFMKAEICWTSNLSMNAFEVGSTTAELVYRMLQNYVNKIIPDVGLSQCFCRCFAKSLPKVPVGW